MKWDYKLENLPKAGALFTIDHDSGTYYWLSDPLDGLPVIFSHAEQGHIDWYLTSIVRLDNPGVYDYAVLDELGHDSLVKEHRQLYDYFLEVDRKLKLVAQLMKIGAAIDLAKTATDSVWEGQRNPFYPRWGDPRAD